MFAVVYYSKVEPNEELLAQYSEKLEAVKTFLGE